MQVETGAQLKNQYEKPKKEKDPQWVACVCVFFCVCNTIIKKSLNLLVLLCESFEFKNETQKHHRAGPELQF